MWVPQPTYRRMWGHASLSFARQTLGKTARDYASLGHFLVYALKSILVHSETNNIYLTLLEPTRQLQLKQCHSIYY